MRGGPGGLYTNFARDGGGAALPILVDSSVWIGYFNGAETPQVVRPA